MADQATQGVFSPLLQQQRIKAALPFVAGSILDVGCGNGALAAFVQPQNYYGVDRDSGVLATAKARYRHHRFEIEVPKDAQFDTVVALAIIEHIKQPAMFLSGLSKNLKSNGHLVITTPHRAFRRCHDLGAQIGLFSRDGADEHEMLFDRKSLIMLATDTGFAVSHYRRFLWGVNQLCVLQHRR